MIKRYKQFEPLIISDFEATEWQHPVHKHNHYELIYIKGGSGKHIINTVPVNYQAGYVFLLGPEEEHYFEVEQETRFVYLKFRDLYIYQEENPFSSGIKHLEYLIKSRETHLSGFHFTGNDQVIINSVFEVILSLTSDLLKNEQLIWMQVLTLAHVLQRNMPLIKSTVHRSKDMQAIFCYIHKHIHEPELLKARAMADHFRFTKDYFGPYFKKNAGSTLRSYIREYRTALIRQRMISGAFSLKQIAAEFGLTDESHVSKVLKHKQL